MYKDKSAEVVSQVLVATKNKPDTEVQKALMKAFPFHVSNIVAWKEYKKEIFKQSGRRM